MTTMAMVASLAGVSISTVSHVLNGTRHVEPETREKVLKAIEATSYRQDAVARAMRRSQTDSVGLIVSDAGEPAFAEMVHGVEHAVTRLGLTLLLANSAEDPDREAQAVEALLERRVDGLILARAAGSRQDVVDGIQGEGTPLVLMDRLCGMRVDQVGVENRLPTIELVKHLVDQGHQRFVFVAGDCRVPTLRERRDAFVEALVQLNLDASAQTIIADVPAFDVIDGQLEQALDADPKPTALIACSTVLAARALKIVQNRNLQLPADIAFATFDGFAYSDLFTPQLTTVRQPAFEVGVAAAELLANRLADKARGSSPVRLAPTTTRLSPTIEYRSSSGTTVRMTPSNF